MLKIREFRKRRNLTIKELSSLSGMSISYISQVERGEIDPSLSSLRKIAAVFQVPVHASGRCGNDGRSDSPKILPENQSFGR